MSNDTIRGLGILVLIIVVVTVVPLATLWMLNTLFGLSLPYTLKNWFAGLLLNMMFASRVSKSSK